MARTLCLLVLTFAVASAQLPLVTERPSAEDFPLVRSSGTAPLLVAAREDAAVHRAVADLQADIVRVTGQHPRRYDLAAATVPAVEDLVLIGTLGQSLLIDQLVAAGQVDVAGLAGAWESFVIQTVAEPFPGVARALVIVGSDRRGTIYGIYELSQAIGVSPWHWWADVAPERRETVFISAVGGRFGPPSVKYRGIFINDEDWALQPWAARTHEPENGDLGPKTYARVFELLLRLKANLLWPAMHPSTAPFNGFAENKQLADQYGIVMGSSHAEPMLRNNVREWTAPAAEYNYLSNRAGVLSYWEERVRENGRFENVYTLGMRGIHDSNMVGPRTNEERIATLQRIFEDQRALLRQHARGGEAAPQMFCAYKEVLDLYRGGLAVPDNVTIVWPDDNFGYIRNFASAAERSHAGGFGVYYHVSYLGRPLAYLWLDTTPPGLIWSEMHKAYEHGADQMWIVNVGDIKPAERATELFLQMAWDINRWNANNLHEFLPQWASREFGPEIAPGVAEVLAEYYRLNFIRKPEHLQWWLPHETPRPSPLSPDDAAKRVGEFRRLAARVSEIEQAVPLHVRDAFFQLVSYPVRGSAAANLRYFHAEAYARLFNYDLGSARQHVVLAREADQQLDELTRRYNEQIAGGKWRDFMTLEPADNQWRSMRIAPLALPASNMGAEVKDLAALPFGLIPATPAPARPRQTIDPADYAANLSGAEASWVRISGFTRNGGVMTVQPSTARSTEDLEGLSGAPRLEYAVELQSPGTHRITLSVLPTHPVVAGRRTRMAVQLDDSPIQVVDTGSIDGSPEWAQGVLNNSVPATLDFTISRAGTAKLRVYMVDPGIAFDAITIEALASSTR